MDEQAERVTLGSAMFRVSEITHGSGRALSFVGPMELKDAWNQTFRELEHVVMGTSVGTKSVEYPLGDE